MHVPAWAEDGSEGVGYVREFVEVCTWLRSDGSAFANIAQEWVDFLCERSTDLQLRGQSGSELRADAFLWAEELSVFVEAWSEQRRDGWDGGEHGSL